MPRKKGNPSPRFRVSKVTVYEHHGAWWVYYRDGGQNHRRKVAEDRSQAETVAAQVNVQLTQQEPTLLTFAPAAVAELRRQFLDYHEKVLHSSIGTVRRYRAATQHLETFAARQSGSLQAHQVKPEAFAAYLRTIEVAPNGHQNTGKRKLRMKGVQFILETCRSLYNYSLKRRHLLPYVGNPFSELPLDRMKVEDAKAIFVFDAATELAFLRRCGDWAFPVHFTLAKTGLRVGELVHLLIEDVDLEGRWLNVRNKTELGWRIKTGQERIVPLLPEVVAVIRAVIGKRKSGPVFLRERLARKRPVLTGDQRELELTLCERRAATELVLTRAEEARLFEDEPALVLPTIPAQPPPTPAGLEVRHVSDDVGRSDLGRVLAVGFGSPTAEGMAEMPPDALDDLVPSLECALDPKVALLVGYLNGVSVSSAELFIVGQIAGITGVATVPAYRRRGLAEALTWAAIREGTERGCTCAALAGLGASFELYKKMGFVHAGNHRAYQRPADEARTLR